MTDTPEYRKARRTMLLWLFITVGLAVSIYPIRHHGAATGSPSHLFMILAGGAMIAHMARRTPGFLWLFLIPVWFILGAVGAPFMFISSFFDWWALRRRQDAGVWR
jgi:hypothetical protein